VLEIIASRIIAPTFGNSIYVWGSLIGVVLAALAAGYAAGGWAADRWPSIEVLTLLVFCAGLLVAAISLVASPTLAAVWALGLGPRSGPLAASGMLFFLPTAIMGMISPFAIRLRAHAMVSIGNTAGALYALSTLGSIVGGLLASFVLLNVARVPVILSGSGAALLALALGSWLLRRRPMRAAGAAVAVLVVVGGPTLRAGALDAARYERDTVYHRITVADEGGVRYLKLDNYWQSALDLSDARRTVFAYVDYMHLPVLFHPHPRRVLMIGLGGGTVPTRYVTDYAPVVFDVPVGGRLRVIPEDGRQFVTRSADRYDIMLLDAYLIDTIPFHLATCEFFTQAKARLTPNGVLGSNVIGAVQGPRSALFRAIFRTVSSVFPTVYVFPVDWGPAGNPQTLRNIILVATSQPRLTVTQILDAAQRMGVRGTPPSAAEAARSLYDASIETTDVPILTDDFAPVETLVQWR
jgi:spermidine synthase